MIKILDWFINNNKTIITNKVTMLVIQNRELWIIIHAKKHDKNQILKISQKLGFGGINIYKYKRKSYGNIYQHP